MGVLVFLFFFTCQRSTSSLASSPSECWVSRNNPKATEQCKMEMQFKVLSIRMDKRRLSRKKTDDVLLQIVNLVQVC